MTNTHPARNAVIAALTVAGALGLLAEAQSAPLNLAPEPLGTSTTSIQPNVMFILDDSGSMAWDYMPNIVIDSDSPPTTTAGCFDSGDTTDGSGAGKIDGPRDQCNLGDPPYMSTDFNNIYYDPRIVYQPGVNHDGTNMTPQNAANTTGAGGPYTRVLTDAYIGGGAVTDIANNWPDRVWCIAKADAAGSGNCRQNSAYRYPDAVFPYGDDSSGNTKYVFGGPYYYRMQTAQWCTDAARTTCVSGSAVNPATHTFNAPEFCSDKELTTCVAGAAVDPLVHVFFGIRWCSDANTLLKCQRKKIGAFIYPKHLGTTASQTGTFAAVPNEGNIKVNSVNAAGATISSIQIGGINVIGGPITIPPGTSATAAGLITTAINAFGSAPDYIVVLPQSGVNAVVQNAVAGAAGVGAAIVVNANQIGTTSSIGRVTVGSSSAPSTSGTLTNITVNGVNMLCSTALAPGPTTFGGTTVNAAGVIAHASLNSNAKRSDFRNAIQSRVNLCAAAAALNNGYTTSTGSSGSGTSISYYVNLIAPVAQGAAPNSQVVTKAGTSTNVANVSFANMGTTQAGVSTPAINTTVASMTGGQDAFSGTRVVRIGVGLFSRTDIIPTNNSYPKAASRTDCAGSDCTYDEEMTNFANWYAYYHTRLQMAKTAIGRAFLSLDDSFRVGFITINPGSTVSASKYLKISNFTVGAGNHKADWYAKLYGSDTVNSTPLREALSRVGWIYAGQLNTGLTNGIPVADDPMTASCQPNFAILSTDGYWNSAGGQKLNGAAMDTQDSNISLTPRPFYDGGATSTVEQTDANTYSVGGPGNTLPALGCSSGRYMVRETTATTTRTLQYNAAGTLTSDVTVTSAPDNHAYTGTCYSTFAAADAARPADNTVTSTTNTNTAGSGSTGSLADVAMYYYLNDLRTTGPYAANNVPITNKDNASYQHMVTFTFGLGLDGQLTYDSNYEEQTSGDFFSLKQGPSNWPAAAQNSPSALDDLWHAAVNGHGVFFSARNPTELADGLSETLNQLTVRVGAGAAAATSNLQPVAGDNFAFTAQYQTGDWVGDLKARTIDLSSGTVSSVQLWSAASLLDSTPYTSRNIYTFDALDPVVLTTALPAGNQLKHFCWPSEGGATCSDGSGLTVPEQGYFNPALLTSYSTAMTGAQQGNASGQRLVNFLRGESAYEDTKSGAATDLFHDRLSLLGDIINAQPSYVKKSPFSYADTDYLKFRACTEGTGTSCLAAQFPDPSHARRGTVYVAANDGMLHAFETDMNNNPYFQTAGITTALTSDDTFTGNNAGNGAERWTYIPGIILPKMYKLAEKNASHNYLVDGSPQVGDICLSTPCAGQSDWRTLLVAGVNSGGAGYYALDITNPLAPKALWEFKHGATCYTSAEIDAGDKATDCYLGLTYGNAIITKRHSDGKWVVIVTSGYNNTQDSSDGGGYLYILDAVTGNILKRLATGAGNTTTPSGLGKIAAWTNNAATDNTALAVYGGDLQGNVWRFQLDSNAGVPPGTNYHSVTLVAVAKDALGNRQPITVKPELGDISSKRVILFGTGLFLQDSDKVAPFTAQTIYGLLDDPTQYPVYPLAFIPNVRAGSDVRVRTFATGSVADTRTVAAGTAPNWGTEHGWLIDLPESGERVNVDPQLQLGTLVIASNVPSGDSCTAGGFSFINYLDYTTGSYVPGSSNNMASVKIASSLAVGLNVVMLPGGAVKTIVTTADNQQLSQDTPLPPRNYSGRRVSWRELLIDK
jgi:type IV pilus assembly protein PilY1